MKSRWKTYLLYASIIIVGGVFIFIINETIRAKNTGFETKKLWDWMDLLIIPLFLAGGAFFLNRGEKGLEREIAKDKQQEEALQNYIDRMSELLLKEKLRTTEEVEVRDVARTRTISIMRVLNTERNNLVIQFLREAELITDEKSILRGADMEKMNLQELDLKGAYLVNVNLRDANLAGAILTNANLADAVLINANLANADLRKASLTDANLGKASLTDANLASADLKGAYLIGANLAGANLGYAKLADAALINANLANAALITANLKDANLKGADLRGANLIDVDLRGASLVGADLRNSKLKYAKVTEEQLAQTRFPNGATTPDEAIHK